MPSVDLVSLPDNLDWLMRPCIEGICKYESLTDGTLDIADVQLMNDALNVRAENERRIRKALEQQNER